MKLSIIIAIVVVAIVISVGAYYYNISSKHAISSVTTSISSLYPGYVDPNEIDNIFGGTWNIVGNSSGYLSINHNNNTITIKYVNGTYITNPASDYPNIYSNSFYNFTLLESYTIYYEKSNSSNIIAIQVLEANNNGIPYLEQDLQTVASLYSNNLTSKTGNISYVKVGNSIMAIYKNYLILLGSNNNYGNNMLTLLNETIKTLK